MSSLWELRHQKATTKIETKHKYIQTHGTKPKKIKKSQNKVQNNPRYPQLTKRHKTEYNQERSQPTRVNKSQISPQH